MPNETVKVARAWKKSSGDPVKYHTTDCVYVERSDNMAEKSIDVVPDYWEECKECAGEMPDQSRRSYEKVSAKLEEMDFEDLPKANNA